MREDSWSVFGAAAGAIAVVLFLAGALVIGERPGFDSPGSEVAAFFDSHRTRIQVCVALDVAATPFLVWFLATVASLTRAGSPAARQTGTIAFGCGLVFVALFLADVAVLAVGALRPENMAADPQLAAALQDVEWLLMGAAAPVAASVLAAFALLALRHRVLWPEWLGWLTAIAALAYALRIGVLFTTEGPFAADGLLGLWVPVAALAGWFFVGSVVLALELRRATNAADLVRGPG
jgi:hypothetical protein